MEILNSYDIHTGETSYYAHDKEGQKVVKVAQYNELPKIVQEVHEARFPLLTPLSWYLAINKNGKSDAGAVATLDLILLKHRTAHVKDGFYLVPFESDRLHAPYPMFSKHLSITKTQAKARCKLLESLGLIDFIYDLSCIAEEGHNVGPSHYVVPKVEAIKAITDLSFDESTLYELDKAA